jgi:predicted acyltransferase
MTDTAATPVAPAASAARWRGLDAFRGLAVIGMLLVNNPGNHDAVYAPLAHSAWNGCTFADLVFPFFLFVVGITTAIARAKDPRGIWRRFGVIVGIGLLLNWFPFYQAGHGVVARLLVLRIPGVMQRIGVCYLVAALIARRASSRTIGVITVVLLVGYYLVSIQAPLAPPEATLAARLDRSLFDWSRWGLGNHLWDSALTWDPEGALSTIPAIATVLLGVLCGRWMMAAQPNTQIRRENQDKGKADLTDIAGVHGYTHGVIRPIRSIRQIGLSLFALSRPERRFSRDTGMMLGGLVSIAIGLAWSVVFPLNKSLWSSSYVLFTAGIAVIVLAIFVVAVDGNPRATWARPLIIFGENPLIAYAGSELARRILHSSIKIPAQGGRLGTDEWVSRQLEAIGLSPDAASLGWALLFLAAWCYALSRLSQRRLFVRA